MEADWEAEVGHGLPVIELPWSGYVDLRQDPSAVDRISEASRYPSLAQALLTLNAAGSPFATAKCDAWISEEPVDPYEFDADQADAQMAFASYIDLVLRDPSGAEAFPIYEALARKLVEKLHRVQGKNGRVDCILRAAWIDGVDGFGITLYATGCAATAASAEERWKHVLQQAVDATIAAALSIKAGE